MKINKAFIRHELLNIMTLIHLMNAHEVDIDKKEAVFKSLKEAEFLVVYEDLLLGEKRKILLENIELKSFIEDNVELYEEWLKKHKIQIHFPRENMIIKADKRIFKHLIEVILLHIIPKTKKITFEIHKKQSLLMIIFDQQKEFKKGEKGWKMEITEKLSKILKVKLITDKHSLRLKF